MLGSNGGAPDLQHILRTYSVLLPEVSQLIVSIVSSRKQHQHADGSSWRQDVCLLSLLHGRSESGIPIVWPRGTNNG